MTRLHMNRFAGRGCVSPVNKKAPSRINFSWSVLRRVSRTAILVCPILVATGCQTFNRGSLNDDEVLELSANNDLVDAERAVAQAAGGADTVAPVRQVSNETWADSTKKSATAVANFVSGREQENVPRAKKFYQNGDALFRQAGDLPVGDALKTYRSAARQFEKAGEAAPGSALEQDALYMQGESLFFADRLTEATEVYQSLQKNFPRSRHNDRVAARLFSISRYWIDTEKSGQNRWFNLTDAKRPRLDTDGHAIRVLDQIRYDDPTGRLADDATMACAAEYIRQKKYDRADEFLTDLRETFTDSDHLFLAHLLGIRCKLEVYAGPKYSGLVLEEADKLVKQTRQRFPVQLQEQKYADLVARAAAEISFLRAERLAYRAEYREKRHEYGAARYYYNELLKLHGDTPQAEIARKRLAKIERYPAIPTRRLSWLTTIFPDPRRGDPLEPTQPGSNESPSNETILR